MEIAVVKENGLGEYDTGGGTRDVKVVVSVDKSLSPRRQREVVIYEILGSLLGFVIPHDLIEEIVTKVIDGLDQIEAE